MDIEICTQANSDQKRQAQERIVRMVLPEECSPCSLDLREHAENKSGNGGRYRI
jgi:hypothetical protein